MMVQGLILRIKLHPLSLIVLLSGLHSYKIRCLESRCCHSKNLNQLTLVWVQHSRKKIEGRSWKDLINVDETTEDSENLKNSKKIVIGKFGNIALSHNVENK